MSLVARANEIQHRAGKLQYYNTPSVQFTFAESSFYLLVFILHLACVLPSPQSAVCIFRKTQQVPGPRVFHRPRHTPPATHTQAIR